MFDGVDLRTRWVSGVYCPVLLLPWGTGQADALALCTRCKRVKFDSPWTLCIDCVLADTIPVSKKGLMMDHCSIPMCGIPAPAYLRGLCEDHFRESLVSRLNQRRELLRQLSQLEKQIGDDVDLLNGDPTTRFARFSILHRCACGYASTSYIEVQSHIDDHLPNSGHAHGPRESLDRPQGTRGASRGPVGSRGGVSSSTLEDE